MALWTALLLAGGIETASAVSLPPGFREEEITAGLDGPTGAAFAPDGRLYLVEKAGRLRVVAPGGGAARTVLDLTGEVANNNDRGMIGVAVDADFDRGSPYVYLAYTRGSDDNGPKSNQLMRLSINPDGSAGTRAIILGTESGGGACPAPANDVDCLTTDHLSHSIGAVRADPDGTLWVASGDGASYATVDPAALRTYREESLNGKLLHIDRNGQGVPGHPYCPGASLAANCAKAHAKGFRNPFRFSLRPGGGVIASDVGWGQWEEIDLVRAGGNYGWPCWEGPVRSPYADLDQCDPYTSASSVDAPAFTYNHSAAVFGYTTGAVQMGPVYEGSAYPAQYRGALFFGDYSQGFIRAFPASGGGWSMSPATLTSWGQSNSALPFAGSALTGGDMGQAFFGTEILSAANGDLVLVDFGDGVNPNGSVRRVRFGAGPTARASADRTSGGLPLTVQFRGDRSSGAASYLWDFGDGTTSGQANPTHTYTREGTFTARLTVTDAGGLQDSVTVSVTAGLEARILGPADESTYAGGERITLRGVGERAGGGTVPSENLRWDVNVRHQGHTHELQDLFGAEASFVAGDDHDADSYYEITFSAAGATGTASTTIQLRPRTAPVTLRSDAPGVGLVFGEHGVTAPHARAALPGFRTSVSAPAQVQVRGTTYPFQRWSDGGARTHDLTIPAGGVDLVALYGIPAAATAGGGQGGAQDAAGAGAGRLSLRIADPWSGRRRRAVNAVRGTLSGAPRGTRIQVAVRRTVASGARCRWWSSRRGALRRQTARCSAPVWMRAKLARSGTRWVVPLKGRLRYGAYHVSARALDSRGRVAKTVVRRVGPAAQGRARR